MTKLKYVDVHSLKYTDSEVWELIKKDDREALITLPIRLGFCHENWRFVQEVCIKLSEHPDETIRGNSFYGLQYVAMNLGRLEKNVVKPILLRGLKDESELVKSRAACAIEDINQFLNWRIGTAAANKLKERSYDAKRLRNNK